VLEAQKQDLMSVCILSVTCKQLFASAVPCATPCQDNDFLSRVDASMVNGNLGMVKLYLDISSHLL
jgi:hypothetical protein